MSAKVHSQRKHSKFSASASERWFNCTGSVALSEGLPDKDTPWSIEGTKGHEVLEELLLTARKNGISKIGHAHFDRKIPREMVRYGVHAANFILGQHSKTPHADLLVETRISLPFIHPEMFGTFDSGIVEYFGTLHVFDYKYGAGHPVSVGTAANPNLQMTFYGIGLAAAYDWDFSRVRLWIVQPRIRGYDGPTFLEMSTKELKSHVPRFQRAVERVEKFPNAYAEGPWCHWCKAKGICPLKQRARVERSRMAFAAPIEE